MEAVSGVVFGLGLFLLALQDLQSQTVAVSGLRFLAVAGTVVVIGRCIAEESMHPVGAAAAGVLPGMILLGVAQVTREAVGEGDAWLFVVAGIYLSVVSVLVLLWTSSFFAMLVGCFVVLKKRGSRKTRLPMIPFVFAAYMILWLGGCFA